VMPSSASTLATAPSRESVLRVVSESSSLAKRQSDDTGENLFVFDLAGHHGALHAFSF